MNPDRTVVKRSLSLLASVCLLGVLSGCAGTAHQRDPMEGFNRAMFSINEDIDSVAVKPVGREQATG